MRFKALALTLFLAACGGEEPPPAPDAGSPCAPSGFHVCACQTVDNQCYLTAPTTQTVGLAPDEVCENAPASTDTGWKGDPKLCVTRTHLAVAWEKTTLEIIRTFWAACVGYAPCKMTSKCTCEVRQ